MKTLSKAYAEFQEMMTENKVREDDDFKSVCRRIGVSPSDLNEFIESELGIDGYEIVYNFANGRKFL